MQPFIVNRILGKAGGGALPYTTTARSNWLLYSSA